MVNVVGSWPRAAEASSEAAARINVFLKPDLYTSLSLIESTVIVIPHSHEADLGSIKGWLCLRFGGEHE
jgi:hypothetical protein